MAKPLQLHEIKQSEILLESANLTSMKPNKIDQVIMVSRKLLGIQVV